MESVSAKKLSMLKSKKDEVTKEIITSFLTHLALMVVELLTMLIILNMADFSNMIRAAFILVVGASIAVLLYLTSLSFIDRVDGIMLDFWHYIKVAVEHKEAVKPQVDLNFVGFQNFDTGKEVDLDELVKGEEKC